MKLNVHLKFDEKFHKRARIFIHLNGIELEEPRCFDFLYIEMGLNSKNLDVLGKNEMLKMGE
jgi:hypothetical protein